MPPRVLAEAPCVSVALSCHCPYGAEYCRGRIRRGRSTVGVTSSTVGVASAVSLSPLSSLRDTALTQQHGRKPPASRRPAPPSPRTNWTRLVLSPVLSGHVSSARVSAPAAPAAAALTPRACTRAGCTSRCRLPGRTRARPGLPRGAPPANPPPSPPYCYPYPCPYCTLTVTDVRQVAWTSSLGGTLTARAAGARARAGRAARTRTRTLESYAGLARGAPPLPLPPY